MSGPTPDPSKDPSKDRPQKQPEIPNSASAPRLPSGHMPALLFIAEEFCHHVAKAFPECCGETLEGPLNRACQKLASDLQPYLTKCPIQGLYDLRKITEKLSTSFDRQEYSKAIDAFTTQLNALICKQRPRLGRKPEKNAGDVVAKINTLLKELPDRFDHKLDEVLKQGMSTGDLLYTLSGESSPRNLAYALSRAALRVIVERNQVLAAIVYIREDWRNALTNNGTVGRPQDFTRLFHSYLKTPVSSDVLTALESGLLIRAATPDRNLPQKIAPASEFSVNSDSPGNHELKNMTLLLSPMVHGRTYIGEIAVLIRKDFPPPPGRALRFHFLAGIGAQCFHSIAQATDMDLQS